MFKNVSLNAIELQLQSDGLNNANYDVVVRLCNLKMYLQMCLKVIYKLWII